MSIRLHASGRLVCALLLMLFTSCGDTNTTNYGSSSSGSSSVTLLGAVRDAGTLQVIPRAEVNLVSATSSTSFGAITAGDGSLAIADVPVGTYTAQVSAPGYAGTEFTVNVSSPAAGDPALKNLGYVLLGRPFDLTVLVANSGTPVAGMPVIVIEYSSMSNCGWYSLPRPVANTFSLVMRSSSTDAAGMAVIGGLSQCGNYEIITSAFDRDGDGLNDYMSNSQDYRYLPAMNNATVSIAVTAVPQYGYWDSQEVISSTTRRINPVMYNTINNTDTGSLSFYTPSPYDASAASQPIRFVFRYPVSLSGVITASYTDNLADPDSDASGSVDTGFPFEVAVPVTASLDASGTILTISPVPGSFPENRLVRLHGSVTTFMSTTQQVTVLRNITNGPDYIYIAKDGPGGVGSAPAITADNYNGGNGAAANVYIEFPEYVTGAVRVLSYVKGGISTIVNGSAISATGEMSYTDGNTGGLCAGRCGSGSGVVYRVNTGIPLADGDSITIAIDVMDIEGNTLTQQTQLTVQ